MENFKFNNTGWINNQNESQHRTWLKSSLCFWIGYASGLETHLGVEKENKIATKEVKEYIKKKIIK